MGGAVGHLYHLYDNPDLSFGEIKGILQAASEGKLEKVSEKLDGMNLVFTWDESGGGLRVARNSGDIKSGGMDAGGLAAKFADRGNLGDAFNSAFKVLNQSLGALPPEARTKVFGPDGRYWYSMELIYAANPNVIQYDGNNVVFHGWPVFKAMPDGSVEKGPGGGVDVLVRYLEKMQSAVKVKDWKVRGPALVALKKMADGSVAKKALSRISQAMAQAKVSDSDTIGDYLENFVEDDARRAGFAPPIASMLAARIAGREGAPNLNDIKKKIDKRDVPKAQEYVKAGTKLAKSAIAPIEQAIHEFAVEFLRGLSSTLIARSDEEVQRLRGEARKAADAIKASGNEQAMAMLQTQLSKLGSYDNLAAAMEGVVFIHKGNAYKFTGAFAPINQILGLFKYGRGKVKISAESKLFADLTNDLIREFFLNERGVGEEFELEQTAAKEEWEAAQAALEAWESNQKKKEAFFLKAKEMGVSPTGEKARRILKSMPEYAYDAVLAAKQRRTLEDRLEKAKRTYATFEPSVVGYEYTTKAAARAAKKPQAELKPVHYDIRSVPKKTWIPWPKNMQKLSGAGYGAAAGKEASDITGTGPGEEWLAYLFGGTVMGGGESFDLMMQDGRAWEVKAVKSEASQIRPGTGGRKAVAKARDWLIRVMKQMNAFYADAQVHHLYKDLISAGAGSEVRALKYVENWLRDEYETIVERGEIPRPRVRAIRTALTILGSFKKKYGPKEGSTVPLVFGDRRIDLSRSEAIEIAKKLRGKEDIESFSAPELVAVNLRSPAFDDPKKFLSDWFSIVNINTIFSKVTGGVFIVKPDSFYLIPKAEIADSLKFVGISQWVPKIVMATAEVADE